MPVVAQNWVSSKLYSAQDAYNQTMSRRKCWSDGIACFDWTANTMAHVHVLAASMQSIAIQHMWSAIKGTIVVRPQAGTEYTAHNMNITARCQLC